MQRIDNINTNRNKRIKYFNSEYWKLQRTVKVIQLQDDDN